MIPKVVAFHANSIYSKLFTYFLSTLYLRNQAAWIRNNQLLCGGLHLYCRNIPSVSFLLSPQLGQLVSFEEGFEVSPYFKTLCPQLDNEQLFLLYFRKPRPYFLQLNLQSYARHFKSVERSESRKSVQRCRRKTGEKLVVCYLFIHLSINVYLILISSSNIALRRFSSSRQCSPNSAE